MLEVKILLGLAILFFTLALILEFIPIIYKVWWIFKKEKNKDADNRD